MDDIYKTIKSSAQGIYKDRGSKFISVAIFVNNQESVKKHLDEIKQQHHSARHHCYAWVIGTNREYHRINDDGEPSGTAGKPIYGQILSRELTNIMIVVARYFGGIKLGKSGLINAYKNAAADALNNAKIITKTVVEIYRINFDYPAMNDVMRILKENDIIQIDRRFELDCSITFKIRKKESKRIIEPFKALKNVNVKHLYTK